MTKLSLRVSAAAFALFAIGCGGDGIAPSETARSMTAALESASPSAPFELDVTAIQLRPTNTRQITATKSANGKLVPDPSIQWTSADAAVATVSATGLVSAIAPGQTIVTARRGAHHVDVSVTVVDPCTPQPMGLGVTTGEITADDCLFTVSGRRSDYYRFGTSMGEIIKIQSSGLDGINGIKANTTDPRLGTVFGSGNIGGVYRVIGNGDPVQFFVSGRDSTKLGAYSVNRTQDTQAHVCGRITFVMPGATFGTPLTSTNACHGSVMFSPIPEALGKPLLVQDYIVKLDEVKPYTITISGISDSFDPALTIYPFVVNATPVAQSVPGPLPAPTTRSVTFTPSAPGYYDIEIASGRFVDNLVTWVAQTGAYTMTVSR